MKKKKPENIKDQIVMTLLLMAAHLGENKKGLDEKFIVDAINVMDTMNFDSVIEMMSKMTQGKYGGTKETI